MAVSREAFIATVQNSEDAQDVDTEVATVEYVDGQLRVIELTSGQRITLLEPAA